MRILLVSQWYDPEPNFKAAPLGSSLAQRGHAVTALTGFPNYPYGRIYPGYRQRLWQIERRGGVRVVRVPLYPDHSRAPVRRALHYLSYAASASVIGTALAGPADVMWVYHPPMTAAIPAWWIGLLRRAPFILEIQDIWPETLEVTEMVRSPRVLRWVGKMAEFFYARAAAITVISPGFKRHLEARGVPAEKIHIIPNWADEAVYRPVAPDPSLRQAYGLAGRFNVVYAGNIGPGQALGTVLDAAGMLIDLPDVQFVMIGDGMDRTRLERLATERGLTNVRFLPHQPAERMPELLALADVLLIHLKRDPLYEITIPSKTLAYLACGRPILCAAAGDAAAVVQAAGAGLACPPQDATALAQAVRGLRTTAPEHRAAMGAAGRSAFISQYTRQVLVDRYEALMQEVGRTGRAGRRVTSPGQEGV